MAERSQAPRRPNLEHRASQTIIDLTDDAEEPRISRVYRPRSPRPPPHFGRSDGTMNLEDVIDLTSDSAEPDIEVVSERRVANPRPPREPPRNPWSQRVDDALSRPRNESPLFVPEAPRISHMAGQFDFLRRIPGFPPLRHFHGDILPAIRNILDEPDEFRRITGSHHPHPRLHQPMPHFLNYEHNPIAGPSVHPDKEPYVPPEPAKFGFTRAPGEDDVIICPSCEQELIAKKDQDPPAAPKAGAKPKNKKDREEHPFWVVKKCGHVYCNDCFLNRKLTAKQLERLKATRKFSGDIKAPQCVVEDCDADVGDKKLWVGIFW